MEINNHSFIELESRVWEALRTGDIDADAGLLADSFLGVYASGFSGKEAHCEQLKSGPIVLSYELSDARIMIFSEELVLLSYLASWVPIKNSKPGRLEKMYVTSIWQRFGDKWRNVFSQDTPLTA